MAISPGYDAPPRWCGGAGCWRSVRAVGAAALLLLCTMTTPAPVTAQAIVSGAIEGVVNDPAGRPMFGVTITITNRSTGRRWIVRTDRGGRYAALFLGAGEYDALYEQIGYLPERIEGIPVTAGHRRDVSLSLVAAEGPVVQARVRVADAALATALGSGPDRWLTGVGGIATMPLDVSDLTAVAATASTAGPRLDVEGMPAWLHTIVMDGMPAAPRPRALGFRTRAASVPLSALSFATLDTRSSDVEYPGSGAIFAGALRGASGQTRIDAYGDFSTDALSVGVSDVAAFQTYRAGARLGGSIVRDTAGFLVGVEYAKLEQPYRSAWPTGGEAASLVALGLDQYGIDLAGIASPATETVERINGFGRVDLRVGESSTLSLRAAGATFPSTAFVAPWSERTVGAESVETATEVFAAATLVSALGDGTIHNDATAGFELSRVHREIPGGGDPGIVEPPATVFATSGLAFGSPLERLADAQVWSAYVRNTIHATTGGHRLKIGAALQLPSYDLTHVYPNVAAFTFTDAQAWGAGTGYYVGVDATAVQHDWKQTRFMLYVQDSWKPSQNLEFTAGARLSFLSNADTLDIRGDVAWTALTGLSNRRLEKRITELEPRFALTWHPAGSSVTVSGAAQVDAQPVDPSVTGELFFRDGSYRVRRGFGAIPDWPVAPDTFTARLEGPTLTMLGPEFQGPRTSRLYGSLAGSIGADLAFTIGAMYRRTEFLPQRRDVNLLSRVAATDQNGRPIYGTLRKEGGLLFADGDSNRRFPEFDAVWGLQATGTSTYSGFTVVAERPLRELVGVRVSYTYSKTDDNWMLGRNGDPYEQLTPFPDSIAGTDWADGRSDLDVPHRAAIGVEFRVPGRVGARIGALYRRQSGYPFTPGYSPGVDANADGSMSNDPAFIDNAVPGTAELVSEWSCLSNTVAGFVERNACRGPAIQALDARFSIGIATSERLSADVVLDALNVIASDDVVLDRAVYRVDSTRDLSMTSDGRTVTVPLIANPGFGQPLLRFTPERVFRLGLRVSW